MCRLDAKPVSGATGGPSVQAAYRITLHARQDTTLLFGGLTWKHERLIHGAGSPQENVPAPDYCSSTTRQGVWKQRTMSPFTVGNLVTSKLEAQVAEGRDHRQVCLFHGGCVVRAASDDEADMKLAWRIGLRRIPRLADSAVRGRTSWTRKRGWKWPPLLPRHSSHRSVADIGRYQLRPDEMEAGSMDDRECSMATICTTSSRIANRGGGYQLAPFLAVLQSRDRKVRQSAQGR